VTYDSDNLADTNTKQGKIHITFELLPNNTFFFGYTAYSIVNGKHAIFVL